MTPECPCVREERPVPPCTRECFHFRLRGYCEHCRQGERPASSTHPPAPPVRWYGPLPVDG